MTGLNLKGPSGNGSGNVVGAASSTVNNLVVFANNTGDLLKESNKALADVSFVNSSETRSAAINMADNVLQRPELKDWAETKTSPSGTGSVNLDYTAGNVFEVTLTGPWTPSFTNPPATGKAGSFTLILTQDSTPRAVAWPYSVRWSDGEAPDITTPSSVHLFSFVTTDAGTKWYGFHAGKNMAVPA